MTKRLAALLALLILAIAGALVYWFAVYIPANSYTNKEFGFTFRTPALWNARGYTTHEYEEDDGTAMLTFGLDMTAKEASSTVLHLDSCPAIEIVAIPNALHESCKDESLCQAMEQVGKNTRYTFFEKNITQELSLATTTMDYGDYFQDFYEVNKAACDAHLAGTYSKDDFKGLKAFNVAGVLSTEATTTSQAK